MLRDLQFCWLTLQLHRTARRGPDLSQQAGTQTKSPTGWQGPADLDHYLVPTKVHRNRKL